MIVKRIGVLSLGRIMGIMYGGIGLFFGAIFAIVSLAGAAIGAGMSESGNAWVGAFFGVGAVVLMPVLYGVLGFVGGLLSALVYNLAARFVGGLELDVS
jgi:hypothetical protein